MAEDPTQRARARAAELLAHLGAADEETLCETILIRGGHYVGRRFSQGLFSALWSPSNNQIQIVNHEGREVCRVALDEADSAAA